MPPAELSHMPLVLLARVRFCSFTAGVMTQSCCHQWLLGHCSAALRYSVKDTRVVSSLGFTTKVL